VRARFSHLHEGGIVDMGRGLSEGAVGEGLGVYEYLAVPSIVLLYQGLGVKY
jgi:hypothetical protein